MHPSLRALLRGFGLAAMLVLTISLILPGLALAQGGQIDQAITKTMWVMHPTATGHIDKLSDIRVPYQGEKEFGELDLFSHPVYMLQQGTGGDQPDGAMQLHSGPLVAGSAGLSFDGLGSGFTGPLGTFTVHSVPPDPNLAVGTTQMVQTVNSAFAIFDKTTGAATYGPYNIQVLWSALPSGSACSGSDGNPLHSISLSDPVVSFDQFAQRWIVSILALPYVTSTGAYTAPFYHCIAYSTSADAAGGYDVFQYNPGSYVSGGTNYLPDYPKQGVWRDAYTYTYDMFSAAGAYQGLVLCGMDRNAIIGGSLSPTVLCFKTPNFAADYALLPANMDGAIYPPLQTSGTAGTDSCSAGSPCQPKALFVEVGNLTGSQTTSYVYRVHFNFTTTAHSAVDTRILVSVPSYNNTDCSDSTKCAVQPAHTGPLPSGQTFATESKLDTLVAHAMWRAAYRNFGSYESMVFAQTVRGSATSTAEARWYEFRGFNSSTGAGTPTVQQAATFNPDSNATFRFMGSIAADHNNNMLMGYTGSSSTIFPSLYVTGRLVGDTVNTMATEQKVFAGLNSQVNISGYAYGYRWGDYSSTVLDPDDCTFWYTNEYEAQAGLFNWSTRVFNWNFGSSNCTSLASITLPIDNAQGGAALTSDTATFDWTPGTGTPTYTLDIGSTQGGNDYCSGTQSYGAGTYTGTLSCLPIDGSTFWVRLTTVPGGFQDYQYTAASLIQPCPVTFPNPGTQTYGVSPITLGATDPACNLPITYTVDSGPATVAGNVLTITGAGTVMVTASQPGSGQYSPGSQQISFGVNKAALTVTANDAAMMYGDSLPTFTAGYSGFVNGDDQGVLSGSPSLTTTATSSSPVGPYPITAALGTLTAANYTFTFVDGTLTINQRNASVTPDPASKVYGQTDPTLSGTLTGFLAGDGVTATYSRTAGETVDGSPYTISATLSPMGALGNYNITYNTAAFAITPAPASVTPDPASKVYGQTDPTFSGTLVGFLAGDGVTATYSRTTGEGVGSYTISATLNTSGPQNKRTDRLSKRLHSSSGVLDNYSITYNTAQFTINAAVLTVTANDATIPDGSLLPTFTASYSGFVNGDDQSVLSGSPSLTTTAPQNPPAGSYPINAAQGTLSAANYTFTFVSGTLTVTPVTAGITSPAKGSTLSGSSATFTWSHESGASAYQLWLGHTAGTHDIISIGTSGLTATATNLPIDGSTIYATLYGYASGSWSVQDTATYTAATIVNAVITSPAKGSTLTGTTVTFTWSAETGATSYQLWVGHSAGTHDIRVLTTSNLTATLSGLPGDGSQIYVTLYGNNGVWTVQDTATYTAAAPAQITSPPKGSTLTGNTATFTWTAETGATSYQIWVGHSAGAHDIRVLTTSNLTATIGGLPTDGSQIYVTLYGLASGAWTVQDTATYTAVTTANATITSPPKGSQFSSSTVTFTWTAESGASSYQLWIGNTPGAHDVTYAGTTGLTLTFNGLPTDGRQLYVTLYGYSGGVWTVQDTADYQAGLLPSLPSK